MENNKNDFQDPFTLDNGSQEYGLPEVSFEPIVRDEEPAPVVKPAFKAEPKKEEKKKNNILPILVSAFIIVLIFGAALYYFVLREPEVVQQTYVPYEAEVPEVIEEEPVDNYADYTPVETNEFPAETKEGSLTIVNGRTNRNYIVVGSFFDEDNANDYGNKLAAQGIDAKIIKGRRFHKLAVADFNTFDEASDQISTFKETYGSEIWVLTY
ncbi:MAG: SPOR domain-containing protein [Bacteroidota bacterium]|nr:SPOR domain-containing protein [Bacteroidota bacterium]